MTLSEIVAFEDWLPLNPDVGETLGRIRSIRESSPCTLSHGFEKVPGYLGGGRDKYAFRVGEHVLKIQTQNPESPFTAQLKPLKRALGLTGVEQLVAVSERSQTIVTDYVPGSMPARLRPDALVRRYISSASLGALRSTLGEMREAGLYVDGPTNLIADGSKISVIDPVNDPRYGVNDFDAVTGMIAEHHQSASGKIGDRPDAEYLTIWHAIQARLHKT